MSQNAVEITRLTHRYGDRTALKDISLRIAEREMFGLLGPNGGGKTTLLRILATLIEPTAGSVHMMGVDVRKQPHQTRRRVGIVFQEVALDDELRVGENLMAHAALHGLTRAQARARIAELLPLLELEGRERDRVGKLSGGLKRRVDLLRGLLHAPPVLLLDEPTSGLDPGARLAFWDLMDRVRRKEGITLLLATHTMDEAARCDRLAIIDEGHLMASGSPEELTAELGSETLWIETADPRSLASSIHAQLGIRARILGSHLQISHANAHELLPSLYQLHGDSILSATVRRPTLEDVFMVHTGRFMEDLTEVESVEVS